MTPSSWGLLNNPPFRQVLRSAAEPTRGRVGHPAEDFKRLYRSRAPVIEGVFAESKQWHGLRRAWRRGLSKMKVQCQLVATVVNFKRLLTLWWCHFGGRALWHDLCEVIAVIWRRLNASLPEPAALRSHT